MMMRLVPRDWSLNELTNGPSDKKKRPSGPRKAWDRKDVFVL